jgi:hypothetical protein
MADFARLVRNGVALAHRMVSSLEVNVTLTRFSQTLQEADGTPVVATTQVVGAIVEYGSRRVRLVNGQETVIETTVFVPQNVTVDSNTKLAIGGVTLGPIEEIRGVQDPIGGRYYTEILCGVSTDRI